MKSVIVITLFLLAAVFVKTTGGGTAVTIDDDDSSGGFSGDATTVDDLADFIIVTKTIHKNPDHNCTTKQYYDSKTSKCQNCTVCHTLQTESSQCSSTQDTVCRDHKELRVLIPNPDQTLYGIHAETIVYNLTLYSDLLKANCSNVTITQLDMAIHPYETHVYGYLALFGGYGPAKHISNLTELTADDPYVLVTCNNVDKYMVVMDINLDIECIDFGEGQDYNEEFYEDDPEIYGNVTEVFPDYEYYYNVFGTQPWGQLVGEWNITDDDDENKILFNSLDMNPDEDVLFMVEEVSATVINHTWTRTFRFGNWTHVMKFRPTDYPQCSFNLTHREVEVKRKTTTPTTTLPKTATTTTTVKTLPPPSIGSVPTMNSIYPCIMSFCIGFASGVAFLFLVHVFEERKRLREKLDEKPEEKTLIFRAPIV